jgi:hypothetical protein
VVKKALRILDEFGPITGKKVVREQRRVAGRVFLYAAPPPLGEGKGAEPQHIEPAPCGMLVVQIGWCGKNYLYRLAGVAVEAC